MFLYVWVFKYILCLGNTLFLVLLFPESFLYQLSVLLIKYISITSYSITFSISTVLKLCSNTMNKATQGRKVYLHIFILVEGRLFITMTGVSAAAGIHDSCTASWVLASWTLSIEPRRSTGNDTKVLKIQTLPLVAYSFMQNHIHLIYRNIANN